MDKVISPHDKLVRETLGQKDTARDFFRNYLPAHLLELIDLDSLEISKDSFIEKELKEFFSDILYKVKFKDEEGFFYLLLEHKSYKDALVQLQLLGYIHQIYCLHVKQTKAKRLPIVIPMVLYHGKTKWKFGTSLSSIISGPCDLLSEYIPDFKFMLFDLTQYSDEEIKGQVVSKTFMMALKHMSRGDIFEKLPEIFLLLQELSEKDTGMQYLETLLRYLFSTIENKDMDKIKDIVEKTFSEEKGGSIMATIAEHFKNEGMRQGIQQGMQQGIQQGIQQGMLEGIELGLSLKFGDKSTALMNTIRSIHDVNKLKAIKDTIRIANSIDEIKSMLN